MADRSDLKARLGWIGFFAGPLLALGTAVLLPRHYLDAGGLIVSFPEAGRTTTALAVWMGVWWVTEAIPISATALLPLAVLPAFGVSPMTAVAASYGHELIFLFMGGFILALSMERWSLHRRIAFFSLRLVGSRPHFIVGGFMTITAIMSMWVSNTATTVLMLPIALSMISLFPFDRKGSHFSICLLLGIAYAASIGGVGTLIGTPPNLFLASYVRTHMGKEISFVRWMAVGLPLVAVFLPIVWVLLTRVLYPVSREPMPEARDLTGSEFKKLGPMSRGEWATFVVFMTTAVAWMTRPWLAHVRIGDVAPFEHLSDSGISMMAAFVLFLIPVDFKKRIFVMDWETAVKLPWGVLVLFGGGLALAAAIKANGLGEFLAAQVSRFAGLPSLVAVVAVTALLVCLTELTSNTATTATFVPILAALAPALHLHPFYLIVPATLGASCAFMLPVATPPNAIIFGSNRISIFDMIRAGVWLNLISILLITLLTYGVALPLLVSLP